MPEVPPLASICSVLFVGKETRISALPAWIPCQPNRYAKRIGGGGAKLPGLLPDVRERIQSELSSAFAAKAPIRKKIVTIRATVLRAPLFETISILDCRCWLDKTTNHLSPKSTGSVDQFEDSRRDAHSLPARISGPRQIQSPGRDLSLFSPTRSRCSPQGCKQA